jgi:hypothetical protein
VKVLIFTASLANPFLDAWVRAFVLAGASVVVLRLDHDALVPQVGGELAECLVLGDSTLPSKKWQLAVEQQLDGEPDVIFYWWGIQSLTDRRARAAWPESKVVLCVDTYPNAAFAVTELREVIRGRRLLSDIDGYVTTSDQMTTLLVRRFHGLADVPVFAALSPFPLSAHAAQPASRPDRELSFCFIGRSDYLYSSDPRMAKDRLGPWLEEFLRRGVAVHLQRPVDGRGADQLLARGFVLYEQLPRTSILDGRFSNHIASFDANLAMYAVVNPTLRRRVASGLSTRFANAVGAPSPVVVPPDATFARRFFEKVPIGFASNRHDEIMLRVARDGEEMRQVWASQHESWSADSTAQELSDFLRDVCGRS